MKFPRNLRSLRNSFELAPFACVFLLLAMLLMVARLLPVPGIQLDLPVSENSPGKELSGADQPTVSVALDVNGRCYYASQIVNEAELKLALAAAAKQSHEPLTLVIQADKSVTYDQLVRLTQLARDAGIQNALLATLPRVVNPPGLHP